jgi:hypothetical protein
MPNFDVIIEPQALVLAAQTPTGGWGSLGAPQVSSQFTALEYRSRMRRAWRQLVYLTPGNRRQFGETVQQWADRIGVNPLFHTMATAFTNGVTT